MNRYLVDYHIHTTLCNHASGEMAEYVRYAISSGFSEIGFSDHSPMPEWYDPKHRMKEKDLAIYVNSVKELRTKFPEITIKLGLEADFYRGTIDYVRMITASYDFDYILGSIHYIGGWGFDNPDNINEFKTRDIDKVYKEYFSLVAEAAETRLFDIIAHPDLIKKFGIFPENGYDDLLYKTLKIVKVNDICLEINTSGLRKPVKEIYPGRRMVEIAKEMEIPITIGSDAHQPEEIGMDFDKGIMLLKDVGYQKISIFNKRMREEISI